MRVAAIDQGTTSTRALLCDGDGQVEILLSLPHRQSHPQPGWVEHDPRELLENIRRCLDALPPVDAIGLTNQGESCLAWDAVSGEPLSPVIVWQDARTETALSRLRRDGAETLTLERAGLPLDPYFSASKLAWIVANLPAAAEALRQRRLRLGTTDAFFRQHFTGQATTDLATASRTSLMSLDRGDWDAELCRLFGVPIECLPPIGPTSGALGGFAGIPFTASLVDQQAALYGHGCRRPGDAKITFGTGAFALAVTENRIAAGPDGLLPTIAWSAGKTVVRAVDGGVYNAASAVDWARRIGLVGGVDELSGFDAAPAISRDLAFVPALSGLACPHWDRQGGALWIGMSLETGRQDMVQALLEGIAFRSAEVILAMDRRVAIGSSVSVDGGLSRSPYLAQFLADILGREVRSNSFDELTAFGCAQMAAEAMGASLSRPQGQQRVFTPAVAPAQAEDWRKQFADAVSRAGRWRRR